MKNERTASGRNVRFIYLLGALLLAGCEPDFAGPKVDQCMRQVLFAACMNGLPAGPQNTRYNDWDEVVDSCASVAYYQSLRRPEIIKPECAI